MKIVRSSCCLGVHRIPIGIPHHLILFSVGTGGKTHLGFSLHLCMLILFIIAIAWTRLIKQVCLLVIKLQNLIYPSVKLYYYLISVIHPWLLLVLVLFIHAAVPELKYLLATSLVTNWLVLLAPIRCETIINFFCQVLLPRKLVRFLDCVLVTLRHMDTCYSVTATNIKSIY